MNRLPKHITTALSAFLLVYSIFYFDTQDVFAQDQNQAPSYDCTDINVAYEDDPSLILEERIALMNQTFFESLNQYDACQSASSAASSAMSGGGSNAGAGTTGGSNAGAGTTGGSNFGEDVSSGKESSGEQSIASSAMSGTEEPKPIPPAQDISEDGDDVSPSDLNEETGEAVTSSHRTKDTGAIPSDIPSADNDDALASQIRYAATQENNPVKKAQLWNEYRKFKGLPEK